MRLDEMDLLVRVARTGSMTLAARQLSMTPAAVSAVVKRVEEAIGVRLFERTTRSIQPTDEGLVVLEGCRDVVDRWQHTLEQVGGAKHEPTGTVHVSAPADTTYQILGPVVVALSDVHAGLQIVVHVTDALQHLHRDAIDMAVRYGPLSDSELWSRKLAASPSVLVASPTYLEARGRPRKPEDLVEHRTITLQRSSVVVTTWTLRGRGRVHEVPLRAPLCADGYLARRWALDGVGIAAKSLLDVIDDLEAGRLVHVLPDYASETMAIHAVFPSRHLTARVRALDSALALEFEARSRRCARWLERRDEASRQKGSVQG